MVSFFANRVVHLKINTNSVSAEGFFQDFCVDGVAVNTNGVSAEDFFRNHPAIVADHLWKPKEHQKGQGP